MSYKYLYYNFNPNTDFTIINQTFITPEQYVGSENLTVDVFDTLTSNKVGILYINVIFNKLNSANPILLNVDHSISLDDGIISYKNYIQSNTLSFPSGKLFTTVLNGNGNYYNIIGNPIAIDVDNNTGYRYITIKL